MRRADTTSFDLNKEPPTTGHLENFLENRRPINLLESRQLYVLGSAKIKKYGGFKGDFLIWAMLMDHILKGEIEELSSSGVNQVCSNVRKGVCLILTRYLMLTGIILYELDSSLLLCLPGDRMDATQ